MNDYIPRHLDETPNVVIENPDTRRTLGKVFYIVSVITAIATMALTFFPELAALPVDISRIIAFINAVVSLLTGAFGLAVTLPNVPKR